MAGGENGRVILPGSAANSLLVQIQQEDHFANFTNDELDNVIHWIESGAPED